MPTQDEIFDKVRNTLVDALGVDEDDVTRTATLRSDLGAESIDLLDIVFRLERNFGIKIPRGELFPDDIMEWLRFRFGDRVVTRAADRMAQEVGQAVQDSRQGYSRRGGILLPRSGLIPAATVQIANPAIAQARPTRFSARRFDARRPSHDRGAVRGHEGRVAPLLRAHPSWPRRHDA